MKRKLNRSRPNSVLPKILVANVDDPIEHEPAEPLEYNMPVSFEVGDLQKAILEKSDRSLKEFFEQEAIRPFIDDRAFAELPEFRPALLPILCEALVMVRIHGKSLTKRQMEVIEQGATMWLILRGAWDDEGKTSYTRFIGHSNEPGHIYWRDASEDEVPKCGRPKEHSADEILELLPPKGLLSADWQELADSKCGVKKRTFHSLKKTLKETGRVLKSKINLKWQPIRNEHELRECNNCVRSASNWTNYLLHPSRSFRSSRRSPRGGWYENTAKSSAMFRRWGQSLTPDSRNRRTVDVLSHWGRTKGIR